MEKKDFSRTPYYLQIREQLFNKIVNGEYKPGDKLPAEEKIAKEYGVSRVTVTKALQELVSRDYLRRVQGDGTYVGKPTIEGNRGEILGLSQSMAQRGFPLETTLLLREILPPTKQIAETLAIPLDREILHLRRIRTVNGAPVVLQDTWVNLSLCPALSEVDFSFRPLYDSLQELGGLRITRTKDLFEAIAADTETCSRLNVALGFPLLKAKRVAYLKGDIPFESAESFYRSDLYALEVVNG